MAAQASIPRNDRGAPFLHRSNQNHTQQAEQLAGHEARLLAIENASFGANKLAVEDYDRERDAQNGRVAALERIYENRLVPDMVAMQGRMNKLEGKIENVEGLAFKNSKAVQEVATNLSKMHKDLVDEIGKLPGKMGKSSNGNGNVEDNPANGQIVSPRDNVCMLQPQSHQLASGMPWVGLNPLYDSPVLMNRYPVYETQYDPFWTRHYRDSSDEDSAYNEQYMPYIRLGFSRTTPGSMFKKGKKDEYELSIGGGRGAMGNKRRKRRSEYRYEMF